MMSGDVPTLTLGYNAMGYRAEGLHFSPSVISACALCACQGFALH